MSGICGILHLDHQPIKRELLKQMMLPLVHRGPDRQDLWLDRNIGLGHTLFCTTYESEHEHQPCTLDGQIFIAADARIDARDELISVLRAKNCTVKNASPDAELILHSYQVWGQDCLKYMLGDFAFAIWDGHKKTLFCARDHFGMKTLYYTRLDNTLIFSNTLDCLRCFPGIDSELNQQAIGDFLLFGSYIWLDKSATLFKNINKVPPAHTLFWNSRNLQLTRYWDIPLDTPLLRYRQEKDYLEHFRTILQNAIKDRLRIDKVVISMSGGMDSSTIAATACEIIRKQSINTKIQAFTAVYDRIHSDQERYFSGLVGDKLDLSINYFSCDDYKLLNPGIQTVEPSEGYTPYCDLAMDRKIASLARVVLGGDGADNVLSPSKTSLMSMMAEMNPLTAIVDFLRLRQQYGIRIPLGTGLMKKFKPKNFTDRKNAATDDSYPCWLDADFEARLGLKERWQEMEMWQPSSLHRRHPESHYSLVFPEWSPKHEYIHNSIDFSPVEYRDPFMDLRLINFVHSLPVYPWLRNKYLLRQAMCKDLPSEVIKRPKTALGDIYSSLLNLSSSQWIDQWQPVPEIEPYINRGAVPKIINNTCDSEEQAINLRPLQLNIWLENLNRSSTKQ